MRNKIIRNKIIPFKNFGAINLFGIIFAKPWMDMSEIKINHEAIHTSQMKELLYIPFYIVYTLEWLWRLVFQKGNAYKNLSFEKEAYENESNLNYLKNRKRFAMWRN